MSRVAIYARYSDDKQNPSSIDDQLTICREEAHRNGWRIIGTYKDAAISGASMVLRPGIKALINDARRGFYDVILAEALDRLSRDQADIATLFKELQFLDIPLYTLAEGKISELHVGLKGTMNALFLKDLAKKTHRGMRGQVEKGKIGGGLCYGYDVVKRLNSEGEPVRGERSINAAEAAVIQRVFADFARGKSPIGIAHSLNAEGVPGPNGALWAATTIRGHPKRGTGLLNNELYAGRIVWNKQRYVKNPQTGKRLARVNPQSEWITVEAPELRIIDDALWQAVKARQDSLSIQYAGMIEAIRTSHNPLTKARRPKSLLSGLIYCGCCGGTVSLRGQGRFACSNNTNTKSCPNNQSIHRDALEARVLNGLRDRLMRPDKAADAIRAYVEETNRLNHDRRASEAADKAELGKIRISIDEILDAVQEGRKSDELFDRLEGLEARQKALRERIASQPIDTPDIHPNLAEVYRRKIEKLTETLKQPEEQAEAAEALRGLIERVIVTPGCKKGEVTAELYGEFGTILNWVNNDSGKLRFGNDIPVSSGMSVSVVAGARFELTTFRL